MEQTRTFYFLVPLLQLPAGVYRAMIWALRWSGTPRDNQNHFVQTLIAEFGLRFERKAKSHDERSYFAKFETERSSILVIFGFWGWNRSIQKLEFTLERKTARIHRSLRWSTYPSHYRLSDCEEFLDWGLNNGNQLYPIARTREEFMNIFCDFCFGQED